MARRSWTQWQYLSFSYHSCLALFLQIPLAGMFSFLINHVKALQIYRRNNQYIKISTYCASKGSVCICIIMISCPSMASLEILYISVVQNSQSHLDPENCYHTAISRLLEPTTLQFAFFNGILLFFMALSLSLCYVPGLWLWGKNRGWENDVGTSLERKAWNK